MSAVQRPPRTSSKQPLLKSKYYQQPGRSSFSAEPGTADDAISPTLSPAVKIPEPAEGVNGNLQNGARSPDEPADMGFDSIPAPVRAASKYGPSHIPQPSLPTGRASASPRTSTDSTEARGSASKPGHRHTKSGGHIADFSMTTMPSRKPLREDSVRSPSIDLNAAPKAEKNEGSRKTAETTSTLRPIAYSPEPNFDDGNNARPSWDGESQASWHAGDDDPGREISPKRADTKSSRKSSVAPTAPPRLPLLYFEQESVDQMDFAYQDPRPASSRFSASQLNLELKRSDSPLIIGLQSEEEKAPGTKLEQDAKKEAGKQDMAEEEIPHSSPELPRHTPLPPLDTAISFGSTAIVKPENRGDKAREERHGSHEAEEEEKGGEKAAAEETLVARGANSREADRDEKQHGLATPPMDADKTGEEGSFYWNSPRSSTEDTRKALEDGEKSKGQDLTPPDEEDKDLTTPKKPPTPPKSDSPDPPSTLVSASALGLGGPSDWEHFGDYDAEEIDDIELYASPKTKEPPGPLPTTFSTAVIEVEPDHEEEVINLDESNHVPQRPFLERKILSTIEERASENLEDMFEGKGFEGKVFGEPEGETIDSRAAFEAGQPLLSKDAHDSRGADDIQHPTPGTGDLRARQSAASSSAETIERISFHVPPPPESNASETNSTHSAEDDGPVHGQNIGQSTMSTVTDLAPREPDRSALIDADAKTPKPPVDDTSSTADTEARSESVSQGGKTRHASSVLSPTSEDGQELITISLQVPPQADRSHDQNGASPTPTMEKRGQDARGIRRSIYPGSIPMDNPYANLEAWARASLNRYVKVLHDEANASSNEDKYKIFLNFMHNEQRIRAVFYDQDDESDVSDIPIARPDPRSVGVGAPVGASNPPSSAGLRISKALPALPTEPEPTPLGSPAPLIYEERAHSSGKGSLQSLEQNRAGDGANGSPSSNAQRADTPTSSRGDDLAAPESPIAKEKVPGNLRGAPSLNALRKALDIVTTRKSSLTSKDTQAMARASIARASGQPTRAEFGADIKSPNATVSQAETPKDSPNSARLDERAPSDGDVDFNQQEGKPYEGDKAANRQSIYQPFSTMLRQSSVRSGPSEAGERRARQHGQTASGSFEAEGGKKSPRSPHNDRLAMSARNRYTILEPLLAVVPQESILRQEPEQLVRLRQGMDSIPDDFSFIHKTVLAWDGEAKQLRERYERERHARQGQNEQRIDELFNEHEIGYSDISRLEADFKRAETNKKADEDREEVQTFVASVFDVVWARINFEMDQLTPLYDECTRLVANASAGRDMFEEDTSGRVPIAPAMEALLILYQKLMVRHQKAFEAVLERDRRLKKVEVAPWYAAGAVDKVKRIERRFEDAEKTAILEFCRQRDERANLLMDVLDQNTLRGVGANQDYMESVMQAVRTISVGLVTGGVGDDDTVSENEVLKAKTITTALARSSEQIVQTFHVADMLLNAADYEVSVANAKLSGADAAAFRRLRDAKAKEDHKLALDLEHRMGLIRSDTTRTQDEITKLLLLIQDRHGGDPAAETGLADGGSDPEREQRLRQALREMAVSKKNGSPSDA